MPMGHIPATLTSLSQPVPMSSRGVPYDQLTEEEKTWTWFTEGAAQYAGNTQKWTARATQRHSGTSLKDSDKGTHS